MRVHNEMGHRPEVPLRDGVSDGVVRRLPARQAPCVTSVGVDAAGLAAVREALRKARLRAYLGDRGHR